MQLGPHYRTIPLSRGQCAIVDASDYDWLAQWKWHAHWNPHTRSFYAVRNVRLSKGKQTRESMHRLILGLPFRDERKGDHIASGLTLFNVRANLRIANDAENARNSRKRKDNTSGIKGVSLRKRTGRWVAQISFNKRVISLGEFTTIEAAQERYRQVSEELHGEFARAA